MLGQSRSAAIMRRNASSALEPWRTLVVFLHCSSPARQRSKRATDNLQFFVRHGLVESKDVTFSLLAEGHNFSVSLPAWHNVLVHPVFNTSGYEFSHYKAFFQRPHHFPACPASRRSCSVSHAEARHHGHGGELGDDGDAHPHAGAHSGGVVVRWQEYDRFILLSDAMRGPFLPPYEEPALWPALATSLLSDRVKLVGASVNCFNCAQDLGSCRDLLHTEGGVTITDAAGLPVLMEQWREMAPGQKWDEIIVNEVGGPVAVRKAGFNLAALQYFWRGHDFLDLERTRDKCALMLEHSQRLLPKADRQIMPREVCAPPLLLVPRECVLAATRAFPVRQVAEDGEEHDTILHTGYMDIGGISCKGCMWGMDHAPFESMFTHHFVSPAFEHGAAQVRLPRTPVSAGYSGLGICPHRCTRRWMQHSGTSPENRVVPPAVIGLILPPPG